MGFQGWFGDQCPTGGMRKSLEDPPVGLPKGPVIEKEVAIQNAADQGWSPLF